MRNAKHTLSLAVLTLMLTACGNTQGDRALSGAGIGAGAGALGGAVHPCVGTALKQVRHRLKIR